MCKSTSHIKIDLIPQEDILGKSRIFQKKIFLMRDRQEKNSAVFKVQSVKGFVLNNFIP